MADQGQSTGGANKFINSVAKGLNNDTSPQTQPEGTYRWALNAMNESVDGDLGFLTNEFGNYECGEIGNDWAIIGHVYIEDDEAVAFLAPKDSSFSSPYYNWGRIVRIKKDCTVEVLITADCLNFKIHHQIQAIVRVRNGCELNLYWTDNFNDIRHINLDSLTDYVVYGKAQYLSEHPAGNSNDYRLSPYDHHDDSSLWDCENMKLFPDFDYPCIEFVEINDSGNLPAGTYQFAVQYLDQDFNPVNWTDLTQPIPVYDDPITAGDLGIKGAASGTINTDGSTASGFAVDGNHTSKAIVLRFTNLDTSFKFLRVAAWPATGGVGQNVEGGRLVMEVPITDTIETFSFGEYNPTTTVYLSRDELTVDRKVFNKAKTIAQHSNRLILGGTEELTIDHIALQRAAQNIEITYTTQTLNAEDSEDVSSVSGKYYFDYRPYMRDEIYAFGIVFYYKDGTNSPTYHIPGREMNRSAANSKKWTYDPATDAWDYGGAGAGLITDGDYNVPGALGYTMGQHNRPPVGNGGWDSDVIVAAANWATTSDMNVMHYDPQDNDVCPELTSPYNRGTGHIHRWEVYNTAIRESEQFMDGEYYTKGQMAYFETRNYIYPDTRDCKGVPIYPHEDLGGGEYAMHFVRHHRMPDTTLEPHFYGARTVQNSNIGDRGDNPFGSSMDTPRTVTLGIEAKNVKIPEHIAQYIQGWKIVKARTEETDRTVIDKGVMFFTFAAAVTWMGRQTDPTLAPSQCGFQFQAGNFNKHIYSFACVHMSAGGNSDLNSADYATAYATFLGWGDDGTTTVVADNYYWLNFDETGNHFNGFVPYGARSTDCIQCPDNEDEDKYYHMMPLAMAHLEFDYYDGADGDDNVSDQIGRGNGYPLGFWGWQTPDESDWSMGAGVNQGYWTKQIVYPCATQAYHGPLSKFGNVSGAQYIKVERVLLGYNYLILCNNACCVNDIATDQSTHTTWTHSSWSGNSLSGIGQYSANRDDGHGGDGGTTYIYQRMSYQQSVVPYSRVDTGMNSQYNSSPKCHSTGDSGTCDWIWDRDAMYNFGLTNVRLEDYVKIEHNSGAHFIPSMGWAPFVNDNEQQETLLMVGYTKGRSGDRYPFAFPWLGNNSEATSCPHDQAWSRRMCKHLEGGNGSNEGVGTAYYVSLKKKSYDAYGAIGALLYHPTHNCLVYTNKVMPSMVMESGPLFGGDSFVSRFAFKQGNENKRCANQVKGSADEECTADFASGAEGTQTPAYGGGWNVRERESGDNESRHAVYNNIVWYWTESYINTELRLGNDAPGERIYPYHFEGVGGGGSYGAISFVDDSAVHDRGQAYAQREGGDPQTANYYDYNQDYSKINEENIYSPLPLQFDFCADCQERHPFRITYSEQTFQEEQRDRYKSFLANNYKDIPAHRGEIWNMFTLNNSVFIHTAESMWRIDPSRNVVSPADGERSVYIGTGDFFSNDIQEILQSDQGYLGCQSQWATMQTETGTFWPDERQGHMFLQQENPKDLTNVGMKAWFENNMNIEIYDQYQNIYNEDFPFIDNPANPAGAGYTAVYDIRHNRFIVTKRDYKLRAPWDTTNPSSPYYQVIEADEYSGNWVISGGQAADCNCVPNPLWEDFDNYVVTEITNALTGEQECEHTWTQTVTSSYTQALPSDTHIWAFYDTTSMGQGAQDAAKDSINNWIANENVPGGLLANWTGQVHHTTKGQPEEWVRWPMDAMATGENVFCICMIDESANRYHTGNALGPTAPSYTAVERTLAWDGDYAAYRLAWNSHTGGGKECSSLVYAVVNQAFKEPFLRHAFSAMHGSNIDSLPVCTNNSNPDDGVGKSCQVGVSATGAGFVDLSMAYTSAPGSNPYASELPMTDYGWGGRWDRRDNSDFGSNLGDDISEFVSAQTVTTTVSTTNDFRQVTPCNWENLMDTGSDICSTCGANSTASAINITLNDNTVEVISSLDDIFECVSWTASFNVGLNQWVSFHSYMPHYYVGMRNHFYSGLNVGAWNVQKGTNIYRHGLYSPDKNNYQTYYGCVQPFVVDIISNDSPMNVNTYDNFHFMTDVSYYEKSTNSYIDERYITFDSVYLYNDYQVTGNLNFAIKDTNVNTMMTTSVNEVANQLLLERKERTWGFNGFRDMAIARGTGTPLFTSAWPSVTTTHWLDKVVNPLAVSSTKTWFERQYLSDKYLGIRLFFSNLAGQGKHKLVMNYLYGSAQQNIR